MQITLNQDEILTAVENYVRSQINIADNQRIEIDLKAGRGENGFTATLDIVPADMSWEAEPASGPAKPEVIKAGQVRESLAKNAPAKPGKSSAEVFGTFGENSNGVDSPLSLRLWRGPGACLGLGMGIAGSDHADPDRRPGL